MLSTNWRRVTGILLWLILLFIFSTLPVWAQDEDAEQEQVPAEEEGEAVEAEAVAPPGFLKITGTDANSVPSVGIRVVGMDSEGRALDPAQDAITIRHNGEVVVADEYVAAPAGNLTIFLLDLTPGTEEQLDQVQNLIETYAGPEYMAEQVDYVAIYRVAEDAAVQLLAPDRFYNSIRNFFINPLETQSGPTALVDSLLTLLNEAETLAPEEGAVTSIVVVTDGTDPLSTGDKASVAPRAAELGIPIHTVHLTNTNLTPEQLAAGENYLRDLATGSRALFAELDDAEAINAIFSRISSFTEHWWLYYTVPDPVGGTYPVELSLLYDPAVTASTSITFSGSTPSVSLNIPAESRSISLPDLEEPVTLSFSADVNWLDGNVRTIQEAQLIVNDEVVQEIDPAQLADFEVAVSNLTFGDNTVQVAVADEQGLEARSSAIVLSVAEGAQQIPPELEPSFPWTLYLTYCLIGLAVLAAVLGLSFFVLSRRGVVRFGRARRRPSLDELEPAPSPARPAPGSSAPGAALATEMYVREATPDTEAPPEPTAYLEVLQSDSSVPARIRLKGTQTRIGRSPQYADIAFENDITMSRLHATITWDGDMYHIYDENSTSGTWVNDQQVINYGLQLLEGDEIYLGKVALRFNLPV